MAAKKPAFTFTDPGCRTDVRLGGLIVLVAVFLWLWKGPETCSRVFLVGAALLIWGIPWQAIQARTGRSGYPWKLGVAMAGLALGMGLDLRYQEAVGQPVRVQDIVIMLGVAGAWVLAWWPVAHLGRRRAEAAA